MSAAPSVPQDSQAGGYVWMLDIHPDILREAQQVLREQANSYGCKSPTFSYRKHEDGRVWVGWTTGKVPWGAVEFA